MNKTCSVYGLYSDRDGRIRYIGQTVRSVSRRLTEHKWFAAVRKNKLSFWILKEIREGYQIKLVVLDDNATWNETEDRVILEYQAMGADLVNARIGGQGIFGWQKTPEQLALARRKRGPHSEAAKAKIRATKAANPHRWSDDHKARMSEKMKRRVFTTAHRAAISAAKMGHSVSDETRQKLSAAHRRAA